MTRRGRTSSAAGYSRTLLAEAFRSKLFRWTMLRGSGRPKHLVTNRRRDASEIVRSTRWKPSPTFWYATRTRSSSIATCHAPKKPRHSSGWVRCRSSGARRNSTCPASRIAPFAENLPRAYRATVRRVCVVAWMSWRSSFSRSAIWKDSTPFAPKRKSFPGPSVRNRIVFTSNNSDTDEGNFKYWAAAKAESGVPYYTGQHGNNYGTHRYMNPSVEESTADRFLTWGWADGLRQHVPAFIFTTAGRKAPAYDPRGGLLLVELCLVWSSASRRGMGTPISAATSRISRNS